MKLNFAIETSQPSGKTFRLEFGIAIPMLLALMVLNHFWLS